MTSRLHKIEITNFKAFKETFTLDLEGRHLLVYGQNGSGKSSLYWAIYTFLQSASKPRNGVAKYFDPNGDQHLLNIHTPDHAAAPGEIAFTFRDQQTGADTTHQLSQSVHSTYNDPFVLKGDLASDFITYRFFFGFSHFRNSAKFNVWPLFEQEILPFCVSTSGQNPLAMWNRIKGGDPNPLSYSGIAGSNAYEQFEQKTSAFASILPGIVDAISDGAQKFYDRHFASGDPAPVTLKLKVTRAPSFTGTNQNNSVFKIPMIEFGVQVGGKTITRPQSFLNEAKLTQLALSVRFAASLVNLHDSPLKLLVLDDLLVSLDMSNRIKVVEILLSEEFASYQKIILTHDLGLFQEFSRCIRPHHHEWSCQKLTGTSATKINATPSKTELQKAEEYLHGYNLDEAAICLRKAAEDMATRYREWAEKKKLPPGEFFSLTENLRAARNKLEEQIPAQLYHQVLHGIPEDHRAHLVTGDDSDIDALTGLDDAERGRLRTARRRLRQLITKDAWKVMENINLIDQALKATERVLNPGAHAGSAPLYEKEIQDAIDLIKKMEKLLG